MLKQVTQIFHKIKLYLEYHGLRETIHWFISRVTAKLKKKFGRPEGISAATPTAYAEAEKLARATGKVPVQWPDYRQYLLDSKETAAVAMKPGKTVFLFAGGVHDDRAAIPVLHLIIDDNFREGLPETAGQQQNQDKQ